MHLVRSCSQPWRGGGARRTTPVVARRCRPLLVYFLFFLPTQRQPHQRGGNAGRGGGGRGSGGGGRRGGARRPGTPTPPLQPGGCAKSRRARCKGADAAALPPRSPGRSAGQPPLALPSTPLSPLLSPLPPAPGRVDPAVIGRGQPPLGTRSLGRHDPPAPPPPGRERGGGMRWLVVVWRGGGVVRTAAAPARRPCTALDLRGGGRCGGGRRVRQVARVRWRRERPRRT